ncbi:hypothetical protein VA596_41630 [Amycolatopsis sp., V23-08]|uniref:DUF222 domain-containing protein n=1 Tax=Amycolatopsis heterodermiae TaxID=3110235 RepID=A0ABU5RIH5_9PSEU|nr:hypothetical protein [Amycolatopsis sp., V23-08]MEA5366088.1 hypothetical protein [Amycolatopsis sp., V23-08]
MPLHPDTPRCSGRAKVKNDQDEVVVGPDGKPLTRPCINPPIKGGKVCHAHGGRAPQVKARAAVRAELAAWGLGDSKVDPGEVLLRLVSQSAARVELYGVLLAEAYDAAERLKAAHEAEQLIETAEQTDDERAAVQVARDDLRRIFNTGGVAALVGNTYGDAKGGGIYATGEAIRGLAKLEADERDRCANFAAKAVAAGLAERQVRLAEKQVQVALAAIDAALEAAGVPAGDRGPAKIAAARHLQLVA